MAAVFPLVNKDGVDKKSKEIFESLKGMDVFYDGSGSIGKRYARADEIGVPYCITIDYQTLEDNTITVRDRDSTKQIRVSIKDLEKGLKEGFKF
jgi:glycyl-tRNA synthetase